MRIYTKSGDKGETGILGGGRVSKTDARIMAIGETDELNAMIGVLRSFKLAAKTDALLEKIQNDLFTVGALLADPEKKYALDGVTADDTVTLEKYIDALEDALPRLKNFILPAGTPFAAHAHLTRAICRRAERSVIALHKKSPLSAEILKYLNRLSDLLFMLAREEMHQKKKKETLWLRKK